MFPVLKSLVNYIIGQKVPNDSINGNEERTGISNHDKNKLIKQFCGKTGVHEELMNDEFAIEELQKEVRAIEGWEEEESEIDVKDNVEIINKEKTEENNLHIPISKLKNQTDTKVSITTCQNKSIELPSNCVLELCQHRVGTVTKLFDQYGIIDQKLRFSFQNLQTKNLHEGSAVKYVVFRKQINEEWHLHKILDIIDESWEEEKKETKSEIVKKTGAINRKIIGQVETKNLRQVFVKPNIKFSLDDVEADFIPLEGDWLSISALVEVDENVQDFVGDVLFVNDIQPLRSRVISGFVTSWDASRSEGIIDKNVWFSRVECEPAYLPSLEDSVAVEAIESTHGFCTWRALSVVSLMENRTTEPSLKTCSKQKDNLKKDSVTSCIRNGISVPRKIDFGCMGVGQTKEHVLEVTNLGNDHHLLVRGRFHGKKSESQIILLTRIDDGSIVGPGQKINCRFSVCGKYVGEFTEVFVFTFKGFKMTCFIHFEVQDKNLMGLIEHIKSDGKNWKDTYSRARNRQFNGSNGIKMRGIQPLRPPAFIPVKFGYFTVPDYLWKAVLGEQNSDCSNAKIITRVGEVVPCLNRELTPSNYSTRFHALLYLEEIEMNIQVRKYDMDEVTLSFVGEYLSLEIPGLAEKRPSILYGDKVNVLKSETSPVFEGFVHKICANEVWLKFHTQFHQSYESEKVTVQFLVGRSPIRRCHIAADLASKNLGEYVLFPNKMKVRDPQLILVDEDDDRAPQHNYLMKSFTARNHQLLKWKSSTMGPSGAPVYIEPGKQYFPALPAPKISKEAVKIKWFNPRLNRCQKDAVRNVLRGEARPLPYVIFGPPGTGKTMTLVETILQIYTLIPDSRILVATPSNSSANLIAERLLISKLLCPGDLVRLVAYHCLEEGLVPEMLLPYSTSCDSSIPKDGEQGTMTYKLKKSSNATVLGRHRITVGTCIALGQLYSMGFPSGHFTHVCVDEAGQATEPEILIPLCFLHKDWGQAILAGDPLQLGPVVNSKISMHFGLGYSYLARLLDCFPYLRDPCGFANCGGFNPKLVTRLVMNYRSLPEILNLPSTMFYDSQLEAQVQETDQEGATLRLLEKFLPQRDTTLPPSIVFHGVRGMNFQDSDCPSWFNPQELVQVIYYLKDFLDAGLTPDDIGVITPYQKQVQKLRSLLNQLELPSPKIGSVEEFQGQERLVIILSAVRSTPKYVTSDIRYSLGFVASPQRLNVALTRARALLIILGNPHLLARDVHWKRTLAYCIEQNSYIGCNLPKYFLDFSSTSSTDDVKE